MKLLRGQAEGELHGGTEGHVSDWSVVESLKQK